MKYSTIKISFAAKLLASAIIFTACGDDSSNTYVIDSKVNNYKALPNCGKSNDAEIATLDSSDAIYVCRDGKWETLDIDFVASDTAKSLKDIPNCAAKQEGNSYFIEKVNIAYICKDGRWEIASKEVTGNTEEKEATEKSSASKKDEDSKAKSSSSEKTSEKKSSASNAKTSGDSDKTSSATAKSSSSAATKNSSSSKTAKSSATAKSSSATAKSSTTVAESSSSKTENIAATLDDAPNCEKNVEGKIYFIEDKDAYYICTSARRWIKQESCGTKVFTSDTAFCYNGVTYSYCGTANYNPDDEFCAEGSTYAKCGGESYDVVKKECKNGKVVDKTELLVHGTEDGDKEVTIFISKDSAFIERKYSGAALSKNGGCRFNMTQELKNTTKIDTTGTGAYLESEGIKDLNEYFNLFSAEERFEDVVGIMMTYGKVELVTDSCDYYFIIRISHELDDIVSKENLELASKVSIFSDSPIPTDFEKCEYSGSYEGIESVFTNEDVETKFCYKGDVYNRCGGTTFATSVIYNPVDSVCLDGSVYSLDAIPGNYEACRLEEDFTGYANTEFQHCKDGFPQLKDGFLTCGATILSSDTAFCHNETIYSLCSGSSFDPATQKCDEGTLMTLCGENYYNASKLKKCEDGVAYGLCSYMRNHKRATNPYILDQQRCNSGIFDDCNGQSYNIENYTCEDGELIAICGGEKYDAAKQFCVSDKLRDLCGGEEYELSSQFCNEGTILDKCGNSRYDPSTQFCHSGTLYTKCSGDEYNPATQSCVQDTIHATCGTTDYNTKKQMCDSRDNRLYKITTIGSQTWMAENLNTTEITYSQYSYCYDGKEENCDKYGRLYYWSTAVDKEIHQCGYEKDCNLPDGNIQGICPEGWHLPSRDEWETLLDVVQCSDWETDQYNNKSCVGSSVLKSEEWDNGSDNYDFSVIAAGLRDNSWTFRYKDEKALFWASTEYNENWGVAISITNFNNKVGIDHMVKNEALSIRCIKDDD